MKSLIELLVITILFKYKRSKAQLCSCIFSGNPKQKYLYGIVACCYINTMVSNIKGEIKMNTPISLNSAINGMKVKMFVNDEYVTEDDAKEKRNREFENRINKFISDKQVFDIKFQMYQGNESVLIMYKK